MKTKKKDKGLNGKGLPIESCWAKINDQKIEDLEKYIYEYLAKCKADNKDDVMEIMIGTDGLSRGVNKTHKEVKLMTVICFRKVGKGAHVIKRRERHVFNRDVPTAEKLNMEVNKTFELVMYLKEIGLNPIVHLDLNPNPEHFSFNVYSAVKGWFESLGCVVCYKPSGPAASFCADYYL